LEVKDFVTFFDDVRDDMTSWRFRSYACSIKAVIIIIAAGRWSFTHEFSMESRVTHCGPSTVDKQ
jgi:hypothetical protein